MVDTESSNLIVRLDKFPGVLCLQNSRISIKALHGTFYPSQEMPGPKDIPRHRRHVSCCGGEILVTLIRVLDSRELLAVVMENHHNLRMVVG